MQKRSYINVIFHSISFLSTVILASKNSLELLKGYYPSIKNRSTNLKNTAHKVNLRSFYILISTENLRLTESLKNFQSKQNIKSSLFQRSFHPRNKLLRAEISCPIMSVFGVTQPAQQPAHFTLFNKYYFAFQFSRVCKH